MERKYEFTGETIRHNCITLHRIRALRDFGNVKAGELGGFIESERNLSHSDDAWVYDLAIARDNSRVRDYAQVRGLSVVSGRAYVGDYAKVLDSAEVSDYSYLSEYAIVKDSAVVGGSAAVTRNAKVGGSACIISSSWVGDPDHVLQFHGFGSKSRVTTACTGSEGIIISCGCFIGNLEEFRAIVKEAHGSSQYADEYLLIADLIEMRLAPHQEAVFEILRNMKGD